MEEKKYVTEWANENLGLTLKITNMVHEEQTPFQHIEIADTLEYGRLLILDGVFQTSVKDEWTYHEMISHVPLMLHPHPEKGAHYRQRRRRCGSGSVPPPLRHPCGPLRY